MAALPSDPSVTEPRSDDQYVVSGGAALRGEVTVQGAKNSALKLLGATVLASGRHVIRNVPGIADVPVMADILRGVGCEVSIDGTVVTVDVDEVDWRAPDDAVQRIRASISMLGPLVGRVRRARLALPGGDKIGARAIDLHLRGLAAMGCEIDVAGGVVEVRAEKLHGADITLDFPSVGATENLVMAAVLADGVTRIDAAAREPEIQDLCNLLVEMGADITGIGGSTLTVRGVDSLRAVDHATVPDRIVAGTWMMMVAATGGEVLLHGIDVAALTLPLMKLAAAGVTCEPVGERAMRVHADGLRSTEFVTLPFPGFPTDLQPQMMVMLTQAAGTSMCTENVFETRYTFVEGLQRMGADIEIDGHHAIIRGRSLLRGATLDALDVRAGAAGVMAGLLASGETIVRDVHHIDRGYDGFEDIVRGLGGAIRRRRADGSEIPASAG